MLKTYLSDFRSGRLNRLQYLGYWLLLAVLVIVVGMGVGFAIGIAEHAVDGELQQAQDQIRGTIGGPTLVGLSIIGAIIFVANLNLQAKRFRDMGLPGWIATAVIVATGVLLTLTLPAQANAMFNLVVLLTLVLVPTGAFARLTSSV